VNHVRKGRKLTAVKKQRLGYIRSRAGFRNEKWEWKPALALMYPNHCFFAVVSVRHFSRGE